MINNVTNEGGALYFDDNRVSTCHAQTDFVAIGMDIYLDGSGVNQRFHISGITSKNVVDHSYLRIPREDIPQFIELLKTLYDNKGAS